MAERLSGAPTSLPLEGLLTVTLASVGIARIASKKERGANFLAKFAGTTKEMVFKDIP